MYIEVVNNNMVKGRWLEKEGGGSMEESTKMNYQWYAFIPAYYVLAVIYVVFGVNNKRFIKCILKCLPIIALLFQLLAILVQYASSGRARSEEISAMKQFMLGLTFSAIGDGCLVFPKVGIAGVISFATSICIYIHVLQSLDSIYNIGIGGIVCGVCICILSSAIILTFRRLSERVRIPRGTRAVMSALIFAYFLILSVLLWAGILLLLKQSDSAGACAAIGVMFFYISDVLIAASAVLDLRILQGRGLIMITYYTAQMVLATHLYFRLLNSFG